MKQTLPTILLRLKTQHGITLFLDKRIEFGHVCKTVFRANKSGQAVIVKIGLTEEARREVLMNRAGYDDMRRIGAASYLPSPCEFMEISGMPILVMEDCGENLFRRLQRSSNPIKVFKRIASELMRLYQATCHRDESGEGQRALLNAFTVLEEQFRDHLGTYEPFLVSQPLLEILKQKLSGISLNLACFACWDFTPEDMFLTPSGLKIIDPPQYVSGIPIVDLACFAGVSRDVYHLPGSKNGYQLVQKLSFDAGKLLGLTESEINFLFNFGRTLQSSLSSRHRIGKEEKLSKKYFREAKKFLAKCLT